MSTPEGLDRNLVLVTGKGGVGKSVVSEALALRLARQQKNVLYVTFEDPRFPAGARERRSANLTHLNGDAEHAFETYISMKIGLSKLTKIFLSNRLIQFLSRIAPGLHDLVLLGQVWFERTNYDHVVVDMPSTGYTLSMFHSTANYARLFRGGPIHHDAEAMLATFADPAQTAFLIVSLPEEMPLRESIELDEKLRALFPETRPRFCVNRKFPDVASPITHPNEFANPLAASAEEYLERRAVLERFNLRLFEEAKIPYFILPFAPPRPGEPAGRLAEQLSEQFP